MESPDWKFSPDWRFTAKSGNSAEATLKYTNGTRGHIEIVWASKHTKEDADEFNAWIVTQFDMKPKIAYSLDNPSALEEARAIAGFLADRN